MHAQVRTLWQPLSCLLDGFVNFAGHRCSGCIFKTYGRERDFGFKNVFEHAHVKLNSMGTGTSGREFHNGDDHFVVESCVCDALSAVAKISHIVQGIKVSNRRHAVFFKEDGVHIDNVRALGIQTHHVDPACQRLKIGFLADCGAKGVHHIKRIFITVQIGDLVPRAASGFEMSKAGF